MGDFDKYCSANWMESGSCGDKIMLDLEIQKGNLEGFPSGIMDEWKIEQKSAGFLATPDIAINEDLYAGSYDV